MEESPFFIYGDMFVCDCDPSPPPSQYFDPIIPYLGWIYTVEKIDQILKVNYI
jgi:hypothetical protein